MSEGPSGGKKPRDKQPNDRRPEQQYHEDTYFRGESDSNVPQPPQPRIGHQGGPSDMPQSFPPSIPLSNTSTRISSTRTTAGSDVPSGHLTPQSGAQANRVAHPNTRLFQDIVPFIGAFAYHPLQAPTGQPVSGRAYPATPRPVTTTSAEIDIGRPPSSCASRNAAHSYDPSGHSSRRAQPVLRASYAHDPDIVAYYRQLREQQQQQQQQRPPRGSQQ